MSPETHPEYLLDDSSLLKTQLFVSLSLLEPG